MRTQTIGEENAGTDARRLGPQALDAALVDAHRRTTAILADLDGCRSAIANGWDVPLRATINPPLWELGHLAWFAEWWTLRDAQPVTHGDPTSPWLAQRPSLLADADRWFDSARVAHDTRWTLDLPSRARVERYVADVLDRVRERLAHEADDDDALYAYRLVLFHEDMHGEALTCLRQTLDYPAPSTIAATLPPVIDAGPLSIAGGPHTSGTMGQAGFTFDNERGIATGILEPFTIDRSCVSNRDYLAFVEADGYRDARLWPGNAGRWRSTHPSPHPAHWRRDVDGRWQQRWFGNWYALPLDTPICHVNAFEAEAWCLWSGRRLPREAEWESVASGSEPDSPFRWGDAVWEWTADPFEPYPGFVPDRYREYSAPWFGSHRVVRGASFATHRRMRHARYRNFYTPDRSDLFVGFRSCSL
ncbi:MAG: selenoneine synthase SenA [Burkholderiaceae bacterium]